MAPPRQTIQNNRQREFWSDFFMLYESLPALWDMRSCLYTDKNSKLKAYDLMVEKLRQVEPNADRETVIRKINIFRTNYRRECSRINVSYMLGKQYKTTLWYYDLLNFLQSQETRRVKKSSYNSSDGGEKSILRKRRVSVLNARQSKLAKTSQPVELPQIIQEESYDYDEDTHYGYDIENEDVIIEDIPGDDEVSQQQQQHYQNEFHSFSLQRIISPKMEHSECSNGEFMGEAEVFAELVHDDQDQAVVNIQQDEKVEENDTTPLEEVEEEWCARPDQPIQLQQPIQQLQLSEIQNFQTPKKIVRHTQTQTMTMPYSPAPPRQPQRRSSGRISEASEILAKSWAIQCDEMSDSQRIYARRAIADILFEGYMGNLGRGSSGTVAPNSMQQMPHQRSEEEIDSSDVYEDGTG